MKTAYICGPLTELDPDFIPVVKMFYEKIADLLQEHTGFRAFVPHEHYDPQKHAHFTPKQVDEAERDQVCNHTNLLVVVAIAPSWGGGIEVEMANQNNIPVVVLCDWHKLRTKRISRLLRGNPAVRTVLEYETEHDAIAKLAEWVRINFEPAHLVTNGSVSKVSLTPQ